MTKKRAPGRSVSLAKAKADHAAQPATAWMVVAGWLLTVAGAVGLGLMIGPRWAAAVGDGLDYVVDPASAATAPGAIALAVFFGPMIGFNLIYFGSAPRHRRVAMLVFVAVLGAELLSVLLAAMWLLGAGQPQADAGSENPTGPLVFVLGCCVAAAAIMGWLGGNSTFDQQRDEYFGTRKATVQVTPVRLWARLSWTLGTFLLVVVFAILPARLAVDHLDDRYSSAPQRAWPQPWTSDSSFATWVGSLSLMLGLLLGVAVSMTIKALLYRTLLSSSAARASRRRPQTIGLRVLRFFHHWPMAVAWSWWTFWLSWGVAEKDVGSIDDGIGVPLLLGLAPFTLGLLLLSQIWRAQDQTGAARPMRLRMGGLVH